MIDYILYKLKEKMKLDDSQGKAEKVVENAVTWAMAAGLIPVPAADMVIVTAIQVDMIRQLARIYNVEFTEGNIKSWLTTLSGGFLPKLGAEAIKLIPGVGQVIGGVSMAMLSGASTYASGQVFIKHFESGGTLKDFEVDKFADYYKEQFEKGKKLAKVLQEEVEQKFKDFYKEFSEYIQNENMNTSTTTSTTQQKENPASQPQAAGQKRQEESQSTTQNNTPPSSKEDAFEKLKQLVDFRDKGLISAEEFEMLKKKLLSTL